ncbi:sigma-54-dependent Fis family transcriptional regulator [Acidaminobacter sp. JC074]|uniref:sigma-54 interaction domain-containing protein n=1 Tax=Acidaminobacter sp. JC074 TaxID=2530199 RepID=UPI001F0F5333|nr:sigma 54-interacting transcriptional regulator [Acidaminobacter sp. JC074]
MKSITLVAGSKRTKETLVNQVRDYLDDSFSLRGYAIDEDEIDCLEGDLIILSSKFIYDELKIDGLINDVNNFIIANRTINNDYLDKIVEIPDKTKVLFVNELPEIVFEMIGHLREIGINHLDFIPFYPDMETYDTSASIAITPGEIDLVPEHVEEILDIGPRIMDFTTITKILAKLDLIEEKAGQFSKRYLEKTTRISKRLAESKHKIVVLNKHLETVIDGLSDGLLVFDDYGTVSVSNENFKKIIKTNLPFHIGRNIKDILYNHDLLDYLMDTSDYEEKIYLVNRVEYAVSKMTLNNHSTVAKFKSVKDTISESDRLKREMVRKGYFAKHEFKDIIGYSESIMHVKNIAEKLSKSELTMLIYGESGSGKELFASAIHNASSRKDGPFLAVNFSALPDDLIESELFGYEEGAFTGAKKGGKAGLFEQAHGGTIFLDEIGDVSLKLQARLLRVLQEKEIMRMGGSEIKPIDVRVVAATNKNLYEMVSNKDFREDLYHRLKMGYIKLPPLRERKSDIPVLINYLLSEISNETVIIEEAVLNKLYQYNWYGNIRELKNTIDYMMAIRDGNTITMTYFPDEDFFQLAKTESLSNQALVEPVSGVNLFILKRIKYYNDNDIPCGREKLSNDTSGTDYEMTQYQMRTKLRKLMNKDLIVMSKGKRGTLITEKGIGLIMGH